MTKDSVKNSNPVMSSLLDDGGQMPSMWAAQDELYSKETMDFYCE